MSLHINNGCRLCGSAGLEMVLSLGETPLANLLLAEEELDLPEDYYPLNLVFCPACSLVQIRETVAPEKLFREYLYFSSFSDTTLQNAAEIAQRMISGQSLDQNSLVAEVASNDGYLLQNFQQKGIPVLGIEPAENIARVARVNGIPTRSDFFGKTLAQALVKEGLRADLIFANNVLAHVPDLNGFIQGLKIFLKEGGRAVIEVPYVREMVDKGEFDTIYHEHLCYFSVTALDRLFRKNGMQLLEVERISMHGGSLRLFAAHAGLPHGSSVERILKEESEIGVDRLTYYQDFAGRVERLKKELCELLEGLKREKYRIAAYGAAAKGTTLLNYFKIGSEMLDFVVDRSTYKQGLYMPGSRIPICDPGKLLEERPDYVVLLAWNFAAEILEQQSAYRAAGGKFIIPIPTLRIV